MHEWNGLFASYHNSGILHAERIEEESAIRAAAIESGLDYARIDLHDVNNKQQVLQAIAAALEFPEYFGMNWDALYDCLTDMSWRRARGCVVLLAGFSSQEGDATTDLDVLIQVLNGVVEFWREREVPFYVILA